MLKPHSSQVIPLCTYYVNNKTAIEVVLHERPVQLLRCTGQCLTRPAQTDTVAPTTVESAQHAATQMDWEAHEAATPETFFSESGGCVSGMQGHVE
jgi:hypothetical protein